MKIVINIDKGDRMGFTIRFTGDLRATDILRAAGALLIGVLEYPACPRERKPWLQSVIRQLQDETGVSVEYTTPIDKAD